MKYIKTLKAIYLFVFLNLPFQVFSQASDGVVVDEIIGRIDDYIVLRSELESTYLEILSRGERISGNTKCAVLKDLITNKLLVAKAEIDSVIVEDGQVDQELNSRMALIINQIGSEEEIERYYNKTIAVFSRKNYVDARENIGRERIGGVILSVDLDLTHPLAFGYNDLSIPIK